MPDVPTTSFSVPFWTDVNVATTKTWRYLVVAEYRLTVLISRPFQETLTVPHVLQVSATIAMRRAWTSVFEIPACGPQPARTAIASISTRPPRGSAPICTVERAGAGSGI